MVFLGFPTVSISIESFYAGGSEREAREAAPARSGELRDDGGGADDGQK